MDINHLKSCISHDEAVISSFVRDPEFADYYLQTVIEDGDEEEICKVQGWYDAAKSIAAGMGYWASLVDNAEKTARDGKNLETVIGLVSHALDILKAAAPAGA